MIKVICAWCKKEMYEKPCAPENDGQTSHGICDECAIAIRKPRAHTMDGSRWVFCCDPTCLLCEDHMPVTDGGTA